MMTLNDRLILKMFALEKGLPKRTHHFIKVYEFAHLIGEGEHLPKDQQQLLEIAAIVHDIGITPSKKKYGYCDSITQGVEGPLRARKLFKDFPEISSNTIDRVCYLIIHHHDYDIIEGLTIIKGIYYAFNYDAVEKCYIQEIQKTRKFKSESF